MNPLQSRITLDPQICHGKPCIRGLRYPVDFLLELLASGMSIEDILGDYPGLERDDLLAALFFGATMTGLTAHRFVEWGTNSLTFRGRPHIAETYMEVYKRFI